MRRFDSHPSRLVVAAPPTSPNSSGVIIVHRHDEFHRIVKRGPGSHGRAAGLQVLPAQRTIDAVEDKNHATFGSFDPHFQGLSRLETKAAEVAIRRVREAAYPLIFRLFGSEMPRGKERKFVLTRRGQDLARIERVLGYRLRLARHDMREHRERPYRKRSAASKRRKK